MIRVAAFEGLDFSGKTTLIAKVKEALEAKGVEVVVFNEPYQDDDLTASLRSMVINPNLDISAQSGIAHTLREYLYKKKINPLLNQNIRNGNFIILTDRCFVSNMVYQSEYYDDMVAIYEMTKKIEEIKHMRLTPDAVFYLEIEHDEYLKRLGTREKVEDIENNMKNPEYYNWMLNKYQVVLETIGPDIPYYKNVPLDKMVETIYHQIQG